MEYRRLGTSGLKIPVLGLGCNPFGIEVDEPTSLRVVHKAVDLGVTYFDTGDSYSAGRSEEYLGKALAGRRHDVVLATKFGGQQSGASRKNILESCDASLQRLQTDYIDVYQIHQPDRETPIGETMRALDDLVRQGKVRYVGCCNLFEWEVCEAQWLAETHHLTPFVSCQEFYNLLYREIEKRMQPFCTKYGLGIIPFFPLAGGLLTETYTRGQEPPPGSRAITRPHFKTRSWDAERSWDIHEQLLAFSHERGWTLPQMSIAWLLARPMTSTVIAGADVPEHLEANIKALDVKLSAEDLVELDRITLGDVDPNDPRRWHL